MVSSGSCVFSMFLGGRFDGEIFQILAFYFVYSAFTVGILSLFPIVVGVFPE